MRGLLSHSSYYLEEEVKETDKEYKDIDKKYKALEAKYNEYKTLLSKFFSMNNYLRRKNGRGSLICDLPEEIGEEERKKYFQTLRHNDKNYVKNIIVSNKKTEYFLELDPIIKGKLQLEDKGFRFKYLFECINNYAETEINNSLKLNKKGFFYSENCYDRIMDINEKLERIVFHLVNKNMYFTNLKIKLKLRKTPLTPENIKFLYTNQNNKAIVDPAGVIIYNGFRANGFSRVLYRLIEEIGGKVEMIPEDSFTDKVFFKQYNNLNIIHSLGVDFRNPLNKLIDINTRRPKGFNNLRELYKNIITHGYANGIRTFYFVPISGGVFEGNKITEDFPELTIRYIKDAIIKHPDIDVELYIKDYNDSIKYLKAAEIIEKELVEQGVVNEIRGITGDFSQKSEKDKERILFDNIDKIEGIITKDFGDFYVKDIERSKKIYETIIDYMIIDLDIKDDIGDDLTGSAVEKLYYNMIENPEFYVNHIANYYNQFSDKRKSEELIRKAFISVAGKIKVSPQKTNKEILDLIQTKLHDRFSYYQSLYDYEQYIPTQTDASQRFQEEQPLITHGVQQEQPLVTPGVQQQQTLAPQRVLEQEQKQEQPLITPGVQREQPLATQRVLEQEQEQKQEQPLITRGVQQEQTLAPQRVQQQQTLYPQGVLKQEQPLASEGKPHVQTLGKRPKNSLDEKTIKKIARRIRSINFTDPGPTTRIQKYDLLLKEELEKHYEITEEEKSFSDEAYDYAKTSFLKENELEDADPSEIYNIINGIVHTDDEPRKNYVKIMEKHYIDKLKERINL